MNKSKKKYIAKHNLLSFGLITDVMLSYIYILSYMINL